MPRAVLIDPDQLVTTPGKAASGPTLTPETIVVDHGKIYVSEHLNSVCQRLGISIQPARIREGRDKGPLERFFRTVREGLLQYLPGYKGPDINSRGLDVEGHAFFYIDQLEAESVNLNEAPSGTLDNDTARAMRLISAETGRLAVLVEDLMEISRFDARAAELHTDEVDAADCVRKTLQNRHWTDPASVVPQLVPGIRARLDPRRFDVVVANLVGNALRHGGTPVTVRVYEEGDHFVTEVADRGPGIHPDVLPHVFDRFYKADPARTRSAGSGLGLAITLENVRLHGGTVEAANHPGGGAVFTVRMPL